MPYEKHRLVEPMNLRSRYDPTEVLTAEKHAPRIPADRLAVGMEHTLAMPARMCSSPAFALKRTIIR